MFKKRDYWLGLLTGTVGAVAVLALASIPGLLEEQRRVDRAVAEARASWWEAPEQSSVVLEVPDLRLEPSLGELSYDWKLQDLEGQTLALSEFEDRVVFLNLWASWCMPCRTELPALQELTRRLAGDERIAVLLVSNEEPEMVRAFEEQEFPGLPFYAGRGLPPERLISGALPVTYVVDCDGRIVLEHAGAADWSDDAVVELLRRLVRKTC